MIRKSLRRIGAFGVATLAAGAAVAALPASAEAYGKTVDNCPAGNVCVYTNTTLSGSPYRKSAGNLGSTGYTVRSIFNNGTQQNNADHIRYQGVVKYTNGSYRLVTGCLHWNETAGSAMSGSATSFDGPTALSWAKWGAECRSDEPVRKYGQRTYP